MGEQVLNGDFAFGGGCVEGGAAGADGLGSDGLIFKGGDEFRDGIVEPDFAFFDHHEGGDGDDGFGHGPDAEEAVAGHGYFGFGVGETVGFGVDDAAAAGDEGDGTLDVVGGDVALHGVADAAEALGGESGLFRGSVGEGGGGGEGGEE